MRVTGGKKQGSWQGLLIMPRDLHCLLRPWGTFKCWGRIGFMSQKENEQEEGKSRTRETGSEVTWINQGKYNLKQKEDSEMLGMTGKDEF